MSYEWKSSGGVSIEIVRNITRGDKLAETNVARPGGRLNKKDGLTRYGNSHVKDKTS